MDHSIPNKLFRDNQDLFRGSLRTIDQHLVAKGLMWLRGRASYPYPTSIHLNLTLRCMGRCVHCRQWTWPTHYEFTIDQLKKLFDIFKSWGVKTITFGGGNPLLHRHIDVAFEMASRAKMEIGVISEGIQMSDELADIICHYARWIRFSLDGPNSEIHDKVRNSPLFDLVISNIKKLQTKKSQILIGLNCVVQKYNIKNISKMVDLAEDIGIDTLLFKIPHGEDNQGHFLPTLNEWKQFVEWVGATVKREDIRVKTNLNELKSLLGFVFKDEDVIQGKPVRSFYINEHIRCFAPLFFLTCDSEGNMYPCDYLQADTRKWDGKYGNMRNEFCLGNVLQNSQGVLDRLEMLMKNRIHTFPSIGYNECGCCTRFCQLNTELTIVDRQIMSVLSEQDIIECLDKVVKTDSDNCFL